MGDLLPLPEELEPKQPINGKELKIEASLSWKMNDGKNQSKISQGLGTNNYIIDICLP